MSPEEIRLKVSKRHPSTVNLVQFFADSHLHPRLKEIVSPVRDTALWLTSVLNDGPELSNALRHLIDAKDSFVRQYLVDVNFQLPPQNANSVISE